MDIAALSIISSQASAQNDASILILRKTMDTMEQNGQGLVNLINTSMPIISPPHLGNNVDINI
ncbi:MAG: putative motility protein [Veillonellaceae bacterium]|jgi:hypothetical protein|nr:putative motility protein [Veillonellaceae bacterium]